MMFRRNGKPVSCEPCRSSKIRCDHLRPICKRCQTRRIDSQCFYHPAPLTRGRTKSLGTPSKGSQSRLRQKSPTARRIEHASVTKNDIHSQPPGYLGSTSFASVFSEPVLDLLSSEDTVPGSVLSLPSDFCAIRASYAHSHTLKLISSFSEYQELVTRYYNQSQFATIPRELVLNPLSRTASYLKTRANKKVRAEEKELINKLSRNSSSGLPNISSDTAVDEFCGWFSGPRLRWEFVGIIFALAGLASTYPGAGPSFKDGKFALEMFAASKSCLDICEQCSQVNDLTIWLRCINVTLASKIFGDTSRIVYRCFSELVSQVFLVGLHRQLSLQEGIPFFLLESRKRIFAATFVRDKNLATYLGRPPLIDSYFCDLELPLDLDDDDIIHPENMRDSVLNRLDRDGWNTNVIPGKSLRSVTGIRLRLQMAILREKILRLSLGNRVADNKALLSDILDDYRKAWEAIPPQHRYENDCWKRLDPHTCVVYLIIYLDYCYTGFQLHRMLLRRGEGSQIILLETAMKLLSAITDFARQQAQMAVLQGRYMWIFLFYGLPGAGALVSELHRCSASGIPFPAPVSRPKIIRDLSVLVSWLETSVFPNRSEYRTCLAINALISRLLDDALHAMTEGTINSSCHISTETHQSKLSNETAVSDVLQPQQVPPITLNTGLNSLDLESINTGFPQGVSEFTSSEDFLNWFDEISWDSHPLMEGSLRSEK